MAFTSYPWSNVHELNLDWLIRRIKEMSVHIDELEAAEEEFNKTAAELRAEMAVMSGRIQELSVLYDNFVITVNARFEALKKSLEDDLDLYKQMLDAQIADFEGETNDKLGDMQTELDDLERTLYYVLNNLPSEIKMINPYTGEMDSLESIINYLANSGKTDSLTATEYDALALTATAYDTAGLTAYEYDWNGKSLLS